MALPHPFWSARSIWSPRPARHCAGRKARAFEVRRSGAAEMTPREARKLHFPQARAHDSISHNSRSASGAAEAPPTASGFGPGAAVEAAAAAAAEWDAGGGVEGPAWTFRGRRPTGGAPPSGRSWLVKCE